MNYNTIYNNIIKKALCENRKRGEKYYECHHIIPKCMGGKDNLENKVLLSGKEHFICHKLLVKIYPNNYKLIKALECMLRTSENQERHKITSKEFEKVKIQAGKAHSAHMKGKKRNPFSEEHRRKIALSRIGKPTTLGFIFSEEWRKNIGKASKGRNLGDKNHMRRADIKERHPALYTSENNPSKNKKSCPYCNILSGGINYKRWHGENCKHKPK